MRTLRLLTPALVVLMALCGCRAFQSNAVRDLASSEVKHLEQLHKGLVKATGPTKLKTSTGETVEVGMTKSLTELAKAWTEVEDSFTVWDQELARLRLKALAPTPVPSVNKRGGELADLALRALGQEAEAARETSDFETSCLALGAAQEEMTAGVTNMVEQAKVTREYTKQFKWALFLSSLDVTAVGAALGELEEGRKLLELAGELAPKIEKVTGQADKAVSALGLEGETVTEIQTLMEILAERMSALEATIADDESDDEEEVP